MRRVILCITGVVLLAGGQALRAAHPANKEAEATLAGSAFEVGGLKFTIPAAWQSEPVESPARTAQWHIPPPKGQTGEGGKVVVFFFGPGIGGSAAETIQTWNNAMLNAAGHPANTDVKNYVAGGFKISQVIIFGAYSHAVSLPGVPPESKPNYGLLGAVIENPKGNIYWRFTGPEALITINQPLFDKIIDSVKPQEQ